MLFNQALASTVLGKIVADKEIWIAARKAASHWKPSKRH